MQQPPEELDRELVTAVLANRPGAFERLVAAHQGLCWHIIYRIVRHPEDARDLCQESFMRVYRYLSGYRYESSLKTWIGRIAYSTAVRHLERKRIPLLELSDPEGEDGGALGTTLCEDSDVEADTIAAESSLVLTAAIDALPPLQRALLTLYHLDELSIAEVSRITGLKDGTIKSHLCRARQRLREILKNQLSERP